MLIAIVAMTSDLVIGKNNTLPRHLPEDLTRFRQLTTGHTVIMGRKTYESLPEKSRPLSSRHNIILTGQQEYAIDNKKANTTVAIYHQIEDIITYCKKNKQEDIFIIGGSEIYNIFLPYYDKIYVTEIKKTYEGDTYFPNFKQEFKEESREEHDTHRFVIYNRHK